MFEKMSQFIKSRNEIQCRSHHQKLIEKYRDFKKIISSFKNHVGKESFSAATNQFL
jgi:hypothetical protein